MCCRTVRTYDEATRTGAALALAVGLALTGCNSPSVQQRADRLCAQVLHHPSVVQATAATVNDVRTWTEGPGVLVAANAFAGADGSEFAAWCWDGGPSTYRAVAAGPNGASVPMGAMDGGGPLPPGPPDFP